MSAPRFQAPKGTSDRLPPRSESVAAVRDALDAPARRAGYALVETPVLEDTALFARGVGESTDVVAKEMYTFDDRGGRSVTLRPEHTVGVLRALAQQGLTKVPLPVKVRYAGPCFRYERPQAGRQRVFEQVGVEAVGSSDPALDAEVVVAAVDAFAGLGLTGVRLLLNSLGDEECRPAYRERLRDFLRGLDLDDDTRARVELNPLRVLDDKRPAVADQLADAPLVVDHLCHACRAHHDAVRAHLTDVGVAWTDAPRLVRGLDYYVRTTFELQHDAAGAQAAVGGGGRYDGLLETIGGPDLPGVGYALGVERTVLACEAEGVLPLAAPSSDVLVVGVGAEAGDDVARAVVRVVTRLRRAGVRAEQTFDGRSLKAALRAADRSGARAAVLVGGRDLAAGVVHVKDLRDGRQQEVALDDAAAAAARAVTDGLRTAPGSTSAPHPPPGPGEDAPRELDGDDVEPGDDAEPDDGQDDDDVGGVWPPGAALSALGGAVVRRLAVRSAAGLLGDVRRSAARTMGSTRYDDDEDVADPAEPAPLGAAGELGGRPDDDPEDPT